MLRGGQPDSEEDSSFYDRLAAESDGCKAKLAAVYLLMMALMASYFVAEHLLFTTRMQEVLRSVGHLQTAYNNINSLKLMKLYSLETYIDNSTFLTYPSPGTTLEGIYSELYSNQRFLDEIIYNDLHPNELSAYNYRNICSPAAISYLSNSQHLGMATDQDFSSEECKNLLGGVLQEGLRMSIVGFAEAYRNISLLNASIYNMSRIDLREVVSIQKYLETPLREFAYEEKDYIKERMSTEVM